SVIALKRFSTEELCQAGLNKLDSILFYLYF
ncbi:MAG: hypothetical protein ACI9KM_002357, partial [Rubritalea sp.]